MEVSRKHNMGNTEYQHIYRDTIQSIQSIQGIQSIQSVQSYDFSLYGSLKVQSRVQSYICNYNKRLQGTLYALYGLYKGFNKGVAGGFRVPIGRDFQNGGVLKTKLTMAYAPFASWYSRQIKTGMSESHKTN